MGSIVNRFVERRRPWTAPEPGAGAPHVAVVGAGAAGLAAAALLRRHGMKVTIFDRATEVGGSWPNRYDSLRLNTVRWMSDLPGLRMDRSLGRWVARDDLVDYLRRYARHHRLDVRLGSDGQIDRVEAIGTGGWRLVRWDGATVVDAVVVATGHARRQVMPEWPGAGDFVGRVLHAGDYRRPSDHEGARVLVVGAGSSGGEICVDLAGAGVDVTWAVRTAPQVFPREVAGIPATPLAPPADCLPDPVLDRLGPWIERRIYGRRDYLPDPAAPMMELLARCKEPMTADGIVDLVRTGRVEVVEAVTALEETGAILADGARRAADHIIAATGYRSGLESFVGHLDVLDDGGRPVAPQPLPGLAFVGYRIPLTGTLWAIEQDAGRVAARLAADLLRSVRPQGLEP